MTASMDDRPYFEKEAKCPVCGEVTTHYYLRDYAYTIERKEEDHFISRYQWAKPEYEGYNIHFFYLWHCPHCRYTDERKMFITNKPEAFKGGFSDVKKTLLSTAGEDAFIKEITQHITYPAETFHSQFLLHLLSLYQQFFPPDYNRNYEKIGKLYLRISWFFRMGLDQGNADESIEKDIDTYFELYNKLQANLMNALHDLENLNQWIEEKIADEKRNGHHFWKKHKLEFHQNYEWFVSVWDTALPLLQNYNNLGEKIRDEYRAKHGNPFEAPFAGYGTFLDYLKNLKKLWPGVVYSETDAIDRAIENFHLAIKSGIYDSKVSRYYAIMRLIVHLNQKLGRYETALKKSHVLLDRLEYFENILADRVKKATTLNASAAEIEKLNQNRMKIREMIRDAREQRAVIQRLKQEADEKRAREIFLANRELSPQELAETMRQQNIDESIIRKFTEELATEKKKGLFQLFKF